MATALIFFVFCALNSVWSAVVNNEVNRVIDASTSVLRITTEIKATNVEKEYHIVIGDENASHLAFMSVTSKGKKLQVSAPVSNGNYSTFVVEVSEASPTLKVVSVFTSVMEPYPAEITQQENQFLRIRNSHYFFSPYRTETQKTTVKLASGTVESFSKLSPFSSKGSSLVFGPYKDVAPFQVSPLAVHFMSNYPMAKFSTMTRELEVSHWGALSVEEVYELKHAGAALKGGFSRFDYQMRRSAPSPSFRSLVTTLPGSATNIYYRDQIGNISTSDMKTDKNGDIELEIQARFPIFGGWQTQFYLGYMVPTESALFVDAATGRFSLKFDYFTGFNDVWVEAMELKVILPEGAADIQVSLPYPAEQTRTTRFTYLDSEFNGGRPVVIIRSQNLVEEHDKQVVISYSFEQRRMYVEPLMLVGVFFAFFVVCMLLSRTSAISRKSASSAHLKESSSSDLLKVAAEKSE